MVFHLCKMLNYIGLKPPANRTNIYKYTNLCCLIKNLAFRESVKWAKWNSPTEKNKNKQKGKKAAHTGARKPIFKDLQLRSKTTFYKLLKQWPLRQAKSQGSNARGSEYMD